MRTIKRRVLKFSYRQADIPYYRLAGKCDVSYARYDAENFKLSSGRRIGTLIKIWTFPTPASLARLARLNYAVTIDSSYCEDRWYCHGISDYVTFDFETEKESNHDRHCCVSANV